MFKRIAITSALVLALLASATACTPPPVVAPITEDSSSWNCATDGNGICGPVRLDRARLLVIDARGREIPYAYEAYGACAMSADGTPIACERTP